MRYIYNATHSQVANENIPMGIVIAYRYKDSIYDERVIDYRIVSDKEIQTFKYESDLCEFMGHKYGQGISHELYPVSFMPNMLERLGLVTPSIKDIKRDTTDINLTNNMFNFPPEASFKLYELASKEWMKMPISFIKREFTEIFNFEPNINTLRMFRIVLESFEQDN